MPNKPSSSIGAEWNTDLQSKYLAMDFKEPEYSLLLNKLWVDYLEQLYRYVLDKKKRQAIQSEKNYIYGVLKKSPGIDELLTSACIQKQQQEKRQQIEASEKTLQEQKDKETQKTYQTMNKTVENYLDGLSAEQLCQIQSEFSNSIQGSVFKRWKENIDFNHHLVSSTFKRYIYQKHLK